MNPHYHPYGAAELTSPPHPPSPDNNNYHGHPGAGGPPPNHSRMMATNGHGIGPLGHHPSGPHDSLPHNHHQHPAFTSAGPPSDGPHHPHHNPSVTNNNNNNNNNNNSTVKICAGCGGKILERFLLHALDRYWHNGCLKCSCCAAMLADLGTSCFTKGGMILCKQDYMRLFGNSGACSACGQTIPASEFVMRSGGGGGPGNGGANSPQQSAAPPHVFHLKCFMCSKCMNPLVPGDRYYMLSGSLVCEQDWHKLLKSTAAAPTVRKGKVGRPRRSRD